MKPTAATPRTARAEEIPNAARDAPEVVDALVAEGALLAALTGAVYVAAATVWVLELHVRSNSWLKAAEDVRGGSGSRGEGGGARSTGSIQARGVVAGDCDLLL